MLEKICAMIGLLGVIAFLGVVTVFVMEPDLWIITIIVLGISIIYFVRELRASGSQVESKGDSDG